jgi:hypothetical protein
MIDIAVKKKEGERHKYKIKFNETKNSNRRLPNLDQFLKNYFLKIIII